MTTFKHILVPTDFSESAELALDLALELAPKFGAQITLLHATWLPPHYYAAYAEGLAWPTEELEGQARKEIDAVLTRAKKQYANVEKALRPGDAWQRILEAAEEGGVDLIVMGTHGRRGIARALLGSIAEKVVRLSPVPVLTVSAEAERRAKEEALAQRKPREASRP